MVTLMSALDPLRDHTFLETPHWDSVLQGQRTSPDGFRYPNVDASTVEFSHAIDSTVGLGVTLSAIERILRCYSTPPEPLSA